MRLDLGISALVALVAGIVYGLNSRANKQVSRRILKIRHRSSSYRVGRKADARSKEDLIERSSLLLTPD